MEKYNEYKYSGIEWLGSIPKHWEVKRIKDTITKIGSGVTPKGGSETYVDEGVPLIRSQNVYNDGLRLDNVSFITEEVHNKMKNSQLKPFDILINITGASIGRTCIFPESIKTANINQHIIYLRVKKKKVDYFSYYLKSNTIQEYIMNVQVGTSKEALNMSQILNIGLPFPDNQEQTQIANYLDAKTTAIDKKIKLLQRKIKHYKAYRKTLINETVTKGLDKTVKLKDSGINWIGEIPEHWEVKRYKSFGKTIKGKNMEMSDLEFENSLPLLSLEYLRNDSVQHPTFCYSNDKSLKSTNEDLVIVWDGAAVGEILKSKVGYVSSTIAKLDINQKKFNTKYFYHLRGAIDYKLKQIPTGMGIPHLNPSLFKNFKCPAPPIKEQQEIAAYLDIKTNTIDKVVKNIETQIITLKELRKTLINEVVTGKVKVSA